MGIAADAAQELHHLITALEDEGHHLADQFRTAFGQLKADVPQLEHDVESDAANVVHTAETQGLNAAEAEAVTDAGTLGAQVASDVAQAVEQPAPASAPEATA